MFVDPYVHSSSDLDDDRRVAETLFKQRRREEGPGLFSRIYAEQVPHVIAACEATNDLSQITGSSLLENEGLWHTLRYCCAPPVSEEDLWTFVGRKFQRVPADVADEAAVALTLLVDPIRFPWVADGRAPTASEHASAILSTTVVIANTRTATQRRGDSSVRQEAAVAAVLKDAGFAFDESRTPIDVLDALPRGCYSQERKVFGAKCDVPVRLEDGRLLALECKVSNGPKNSWKRLNREVGGKAERWKAAFGSQVVTGAVVAGVFDLSCLVSAQRDTKVAIFWEHDFATLRDFLARAK